MVLQDGCFRMPDHDNALVMFPLGARLAIDRQGYLAYGAGAPGYGRVGETLAFPGLVYDVTSPELTAPIHRACGAGKVVKINGMMSEAAERSQATVSANAQALRDLRQRLRPVRERGARGAGKMQGADGLRQLPADPAVHRSRRRPPARRSTRLSAGLCRTPEGYVRPLPGWLAEFADR